jgi:hypothetical protein
MEKVLVIEAKYREALSAVRGVTGLKAAGDGEFIWLWGITAGDTTNKLIVSLPILYSYTLNETGLLFPDGSKTPTKKLPDFDWMPIKKFMPVTMPVSAMPGSAPAKMAVVLSRTGQIKETYALLVTLSDWKIYADSAPETRLRQLSFAVSAYGETLIYGQPLPNIPGRAYWRRGQMLLPAGFDFDPPVTAELIAVQLNGDQSAFMLFGADGNWQNIPLAAFQSARRSAVRLTVIDNG